MDESFQVKVVYVKRWFNQNIGQLNSLININQENATMNIMFNDK